MRVSVDSDKCQSNGLCVLTAAEVFDFDDDDKLRYEAYPDASLIEAVRDAVAACPTRAIQIEQRA